MDLEDGLFFWSTEAIIRSQNTYSLRLLLSNNICGIKTARTQNITVYLYSYTTVDKQLHLWLRFSLKTLLAT